VVISVVYLLVRCLLGCLMVLSRQRVSKDAELLVLSLRSVGDLCVAGYREQGRPGVAGWAWR